MTNHTKTPSILINNPLTLLYWLFFRALALRRYARSIHEELDEDLLVWEVRQEVEHDPRFKALCRARWWLLATAPLCAVLLWGGMSSLFGVGFEWSRALFLVIGCTGGTLLGDGLRWLFPKRASRWLGWVWWLFLIFSFIIFIPARLFPVLESFTLPALLTRISPSFEISVFTLGVGFGVAAGVVLGVALSVAAGVGFGVVGGVALGVAFDVPRGVVFGVVLGVAAGVALDVTLSVALGVMVGMMGGVGLIVALGEPLGRPSGVTFAVAYVICFLRLPLYLFWELPRAFQLSGRASQVPAQAVALWRKQPLHYDEVIQLRLVGLPKHLAAIAKQDTEACSDALADVGDSLRQQWAIPQALRLILTHELERRRTFALIVRFYEATGWFPMGLFEEDEAQLVPDLRRISEDTRGALDATTREAREQLLRDLADRLQTLRLSLGRHDQARLRVYAESLTQWQRILEAEAERVAQQPEVSGELPMRYVAGAVLEHGERSFQRGNDIFEALEGLLINQTQKVTPLLLGQPRTGKSSVLKQLPVRLGAQVLPVYLDMERLANTDSAVSFFADLVGVIRRETLRHRKPVSLPPLDERLLVGDPYRVFENWIEEVEKALGEQRWLLLALDEFNRIDDAVRHGRLDGRIFFLLRSLIQHHPQVVLALCGTFALSECDPRWYEALKSVRNLPVSYFKPDEARRVFTRPAPDFPQNVYSDAAIERALELTGGQPFLIHLLGESIINRYNHSRRHIAPNTPKGLPLPASAVDDALPTVLTGGDTFFMSLWQWLLQISYEQERAAALLIALARTQPIDDIGTPTLRQELIELFCERDLLEPDASGSYRFRVPLVAHWIRKQRRLLRRVN